jgi:hypothetical protein
MRLSALLFFAFLPLLSSCALPSPYGALRIPDLPEVAAQQLSPEQVELIPSPGLPADCRRDAVLLKAAKLTLENADTHFEILGEANAQYAAISARHGSGSVIIRFCSGVCSGMFSAQALAHILVPKFVAPPAFSFFSDREPPICRNELN